MRRHITLVKRLASKRVPESEKKKELITAEKVVKVIAETTSKHLEKVL